MTPVHFDEAAILKDIEQLVAAAEGQHDQASASALREVLIPFHKWHVGQANRCVSTGEIEDALVMLVTNFVATVVGSRSEEPTSIDPRYVAHLLRRIVVELSGLDADTEGALVHYPIEGGHA